MKLEADNLSLMFRYDDFHRPKICDCVELIKIQHLRE